MASIGSSVGSSVEKVQIQPNPSPAVDRGQALGESGFAEMLRLKTTSPEAKTAAAPALPDFKFSNHAVERMKSRGISMGPADIEKMKQMIDKAEKKGAKDTLVLFGENALIVNVKNRTVVTAMDRAMVKENVFTNIDSTVIL